MLSPLCRKLTILLVIAGMTVATGGVGVSRKLASAQSTVAPLKYALLVAINRYEDDQLNQPRLKYAEADAAAVKEILLKSNYSVETLIGEAATQAAIREKLAKLNRKGNADGVVVLGFFGHGVEFESSKEAMFIPFDASRRLAKDPDGNQLYGSNGVKLDEPDPATLIGMGEILDSLRLCKAGNKLLLADCCRNNPNAARNSRTFGSNVKLADLPNNSAAVFACSQGENAYEDDAWQNGAMTKCFVDLISELSTDSSDIGAIAGKLRRRVNALVSQSTNGGRRQTVHPIVNGIVDLQLSVEDANKKLPEELEKLLSSNQIELILTTCGGTSLAVSQDGSRLLTVGSTNDEPENNYRVWDSETGRLLYAWSAPESKAIINANGTMVLNSSTFELMDLETGKKEIVDRLSLSPEGSWSISPDMTKLVIGRDVIDRISDQKLFSFETKDDKFAVRAWNSDGTACLATEGLGAWRILSASSGKSLRSGDRPLGSYSSISFGATNSLRYLIGYKSDEGELVVDTMDGTNILLDSRINGYVPLPLLRETASQLQVLYPDGEYWTDQASKQRIFNRTDSAIRGKIHRNALFQYEMGLSKSSIDSQKIEWSRPSLSRLSGLDHSVSGLRVMISGSAAGCSVEGSYCVAASPGKCVFIGKDESLAAPPGMIFNQVSFDNRTSLYTKHSDNGGPESFLLRPDQNLKKIEDAAHLLLAPDGSKLLNLKTSKIGGQNASAVLTEINTADVKAVQSFGKTSDERHWVSDLSISDSGDLVLTNPSGFASDVDDPKQPPTLWRDCKKVRNFSGKTSGALSHDGAYVALVGAKHEPIALWDVRADAAIRNLKCQLPDPSACVFSRTSRLLAIVQQTDIGNYGYSTQVEVFNVENGYSLQKLDLVDWFDPQDLEFSVDDEWLLAEEHSRIRWWSLKSGMPEIQMHYLNDGADWICIAADNRFDASPAARKLINWRRKDSNEVFASPDLESRLYTPGLMQLILDRK